MFITIDQKNISGATSDYDINTDHIVLIREERHFANRALKYHEITLSSGQTIGILEPKEIARIKLIMQADKYKDGMVINSHQIEIPFEQPEFNTKPRPTAKKK